MICCSVGWDVADENKVNPNTVLLLFTGERGPRGFTGKEILVGFRVACLGV